MTTVRPQTQPDQGPDPQTAEVTVPWSERVVVGAALLGHPDGLDQLDVDRDLTDPRLRLVAHAIRQLEADGIPVEPAAVVVILQRTPNTGWARSSTLGVFVGELTSVDTVPIPASAKWHATQVREATARRRILQAAHRIEDYARQGVDLATVSPLLVEEVLACSESIARISP